MSTTDSAPSLLKRLTVGRNPKVTAVRAIILAGIAYVVFSYVLIPVRVSGISMEPTYRNGGVNLVNKWSYRWKSPARGDVVSVRTSGQHISYLKRVIALPGETIEIQNGLVLINGVPLTEEYLVDRRPWNIPARKLKGDEYYLIGDNRRMTEEEHEFGATEARRIVGKVMW